MGSRNRKRKAVRAMHENDRAVAAQTTTPRMVERDRQYRRNNPARTAPTVKPDWVYDLETGGHQYVKGDRAPAVSQSRQQKQENKRVRSALKRESAKRDLQPLSSGREGVAHPVRGKIDRTAGVQIRRSKGWARVQIRQT